MKKPKLYIDSLKSPGLTPREKKVLISERIAAAQEANRAAQMALLSKEPQPNQPPTKSFESNYTILEWRGQKFFIPKNKWGW